MYCVSGHYIYVEAVVVEAVAVYSTSNVKTFLVATTKHFLQKNSLQHDATSNIKCSSYTVLHSSASIIWHFPVPVSLIMRKIGKKSSEYRNILWIEWFHCIQKFKLDFLVQLAVLKNKILNATRRCLNMPHRQTLTQITTLKLTAFENVLVLAVIINNFDDFRVLRLYGKHLYFTASL